MLTYINQLIWSLLYILEIFLQSVFSRRVIFSQLQNVLNKSFLKQQNIFNQFTKATIWILVQCYRKIKTCFWKSLVCHNITSRSSFRISLSYSNRISRIMMFQKYFKIHAHKWIFIWKNLFHKSMNSK